MTTITIPARIVRYLREALHSRLGMAAEDIGQVSHEDGPAKPDLYTEPIERFDRARALLDLIGWKDVAEEAPATINLARHRQTLLDALRAQIATERDMAGEDRSLKGADEQITCAQRRKADIERFLVLVGVSPADED